MIDASTTGTFAGRQVTPGLDHGLQRVGVELAADVQPQLAVVEEDLLCRGQGLDEQPLLHGVGQRDPSGPRGVAGVRYQPDLQHVVLYEQNCPARGADRGRPELRPLAGAAGDAVI